MNNKGQYGEGIIIGILIASITVFAFIYIIGTSEDFNKITSKIDARQEFCPDRDFFYIDGKNYCNGKEFYCNSYKCIYVEEIKQVPQTIEHNNDSTKRDV